MPQSSKRIFRNGPAPAEVIARDHEFRRRIREEFPPLERPVEAGAFGERLREALVASGTSPSRLAKAAKVSEVDLRQFIDGKRDLRIATVDRLAKVLGLRLTGG